MYHSPPMHFLPISLHRPNIFITFAAIRSHGGGRSFLHFICKKNSIMIDPQIIRNIVQDTIADTDYFIVDIKVTPTNEITVEIDSMTGVDIATCETISRAIEAALDRDTEDFELEVGSAGLTAPFKVKQQYEKNIGNEVEVLTRSGSKFSGTLTEVADDFSTFTVMVNQKVKHPGAKRPVIEQTPVVTPVADAKSVTYKINFK